MKNSSEFIGFDNIHLELKSNNQAEFINFSESNFEITKEFVPTNYFPFIAIFFRDCSLQFLNKRSWLGGTYSNSVSLTIEGSLPTQFYLHDNCFLLLFSFKSFGYTDHLIFEINLILQGFLVTRRQLMYSDLKPRL